MFTRIIASAVLLQAFWLVTPSHGEEIEATTGFKAIQVLSYPALESFTWDERGTMWILSSAPGRLTLGNVDSKESVRSVRSFQRLGNGASSLLVTENSVFVGDGEAIHKFSATDSSSTDMLIPPRSLFPAHPEIGAMAWSPLGPVYFIFHSSLRGEGGIGRASIDGRRWDVVAKGSFANFAFDLNGFVVAADESSGLMFRVASGLDYDRGLASYKKSDLAIKTGHPNLQARFAMVYSGSDWSVDHRGTWLVNSAAPNTIEQFEERDGTLQHRRTVARLDQGSALRDMQIGPDGAAWMLLGPANDSEGNQKRTIYRLTAETSEPVTPSDLHSLDNEALVAELGSPNAWRRDAALRLLDRREDLRATLGLHPRTPMTDTFSDKTNSAATRVFAMLSLHRLGLLDETFLENAVDDEELQVRTWAGLLLGERNYPTSVAFHKLMKLAKETNLVARSAAAIGARQFVSGSLAIDTPPRAMPLREVFTGGILSTLWFSTEKGSSPEFDLLFWNAVRPITAFDHAHPMGFFNGDNDSKLALAYWIIGLITRQIAESDHHLKQEEAMIMVSELNPKNSRMIIAALRGMKNATRRVTPTERSIQVLAEFAKSDNLEIATLARDLAREWQMPFK